MEEQLLIQLIERMDRMESLLSKQIAPVTHDRIGGIELAEEVTGFSQSTIYHHVAKGMPHYKRGKKLMFAEKKLREYMIGVDEEFEMKMSNFRNKKAGRKPRRVLAMM